MKGSDNSTVTSSWAVVMALSMPAMALAAILVGFRLPLLPLPVWEGEVLEVAVLRSRRNLLRILSPQ
jgi:hypothetical protein